MLRRVSFIFQTRVTSVCLGLFEVSGREGSCPQRRKGAGSMSEAPWEVEEGKDLGEVGGCCVVRGQDCWQY